MTEPEVDGADVRTGPDAEYLAQLLAWAEVENEKRERGERSEWDQGDWISLPSHEPYDYPEGELSSFPCGTACCIAGKVAMDAGALPHLVGRNGAYPHYAGSIVNLPDGTQVLVDEFAKDRLGLTRDQSEALFSGSNDIEDLRLVIGVIVAKPYIGFQELIDLREMDRDARYSA